MKKRLLFLVLLVVMLCPSAAFANDNPFSGYKDISITEITYGNSTVWVDDVPIGTTLLVKVKGKTYKGKAYYKSKYDNTQCMDADIPICKIGKKIKIILKKDGYTKTYIRTVKKDPNEVIKTFSDITKDSRKIKVKLKNITPGDKVIIYMGKKRYIKKLKNGGNMTITMKLPKKKPIKWGKRFDVELHNKYGQYLHGFYDRLYYARYLRKGFTKKQFKNCIHYWGSPDSTAQASSGWSYWYYDDGSYIIFKNGRVSSWYNVH